MLTILYSLALLSIPVEVIPRLQTRQLLLQQVVVEEVGEL